MKKKLKIECKWLYDQNNNKTSVALSLKDFERLMEELEDLHDIYTVYKRTSKSSKTVSLEQVEQELLSNDIRKQS